MTSPKLAPKAAALAARQKSAVAQGVSTKQIYVAKAENAKLWDVDGKEYVDFAAGIAVVNTGHRHPKVIAAARDQMDAFTHTSINVAPYESYIALAERLNRIAPVAGEKRTMFVTTGAEAVENAVKIARAATGRPGVIAFGGAFHGRTLLGMALTGKVVPYKKGFGPFPAEVYHAPFPKSFHGVTAEQALKGVRDLFANDVDPARIAAIIVEPVQGEGGFYPAPADFLKALRALCDEHGILLIGDEIQTGFARTGKMFALEHAGVTADIVTMAKGLAGGFPLSAVTARAELMDKVPVGGLGGTYAGSPVALAAAHAVLDVIEEEGLVARAAEIGKIMTDRLVAMSKKNEFSSIGDVRGLGAMVAMELVKDKVTKTPDKELTDKLVARAQEKGLILLTCGTGFNVIRLLAPLTIPMDDLAKGLDILEESFAEIVR
jgi:4-aminobutyrate aminotransferase